MKYQDTSGEVKFWLEMIEWWHSNQLGPVPLRMEQALALAHEKDYHFEPSSKLIVHPIS